MINRVIPTPIDRQAVAAAQASALPDELLAVMVGVFAALADPTRARILHALSERDLCVRDLSILTGVSESAVSHQLRFLRDKRLVKSRRNGTIISYSLDDHHVAALFKEAAYHADHVKSQLPDHPYR